MIEGTATVEVLCPGPQKEDEALTLRIRTDLDKQKAPELARPVDGWEPRATIFLSEDARYEVVGEYPTWEAAEEAADILNQVAQANLRAEHAEMSRRLSEARVIISSLLLVLHDHSGSKKRISDKARAWLGLKPGARVGSWSDKYEVKYGTNRN